MIDLSHTDTVAYVRVSTERQAGEVQTSLADQVAAVERLAERMGRTIGHVFRDEGASGATVKQRPGFRAMLAACEAAPRTGRRKTPGVILVLNDSRFGRFPDPEEAAYWRVRLSHHGWLVRFAEGDDTEDRTTRTLMRAIGGAQASAFRESLRQNVRRGIRGTSGQGYWTFRTPYGYRRKVVFPLGRERVLEHGVLSAPGEKVTLVPHEREAAIVREAFHRYAAGGESANSLVEWLLVAAPERKWTRAAVRWMLLNPVYVGDIVAQPLESEAGDHRPHSPEPDRALVFGKRAAHEAIVARAIFAAAQSRMADNRARRRGTRSDWIVSGIVRCRCGAPFAGGGGGGRGGRLRSYMCATRGRHQSGRCEYPGTVLKPYLEDAVISTVADEVGAPRARRRLVRVLARVMAQEAAGETETVEDLERAVAAVEARQARVVAAIADGALTSREAGPQLAAIRSELAALSARRDAIVPTADRLARLERERADLLAVLHDFPQLVQDAVGHGRAQAVRALLAPWVRSAVFDTDTRILTLEIRHVPATAGLPIGDMTSNVYATKRKGAQDGVTVRQVRVGRGA